MGRLWPRGESLGRGQAVTGCSLSVESLFFLGAYTVMLYSEVGGRGASSAAVQWGSRRIVHPLPPLTSPRSPPLRGIALTAEAPPHPPLTAVVVGAAEGAPAPPLLDGSLRLLDAPGI